jgi:hypothetical protein
MLANITESTILVNKTDYGSFPNFESINGPPLHEFLRLGPGLSVRNLSLLMGVYANFVH